MTCKRQNSDRLWPRHCLCCALVCWSERCRAELVSVRICLTSCFIRHCTSLPSAMWHKLPQHTCRRLTSCLAEADRPCWLRCGGQRRLEHTDTPHSADTQPATDTAGEQTGAASSSCTRDSVFNCFADHKCRSRFNACPPGCTQLYCFAVDGDTLEAAQREPPANSPAARTKKLKRREIGSYADYGDDFDREVLPGQWSTGGRVVSVQEFLQAFDTFDCQAEVFKCLSTKFKIRTPCVPVARWGSCLA